MIGKVIFANVPYLTRENFMDVLPQNVYGQGLDKERYFSKLLMCSNMLKEKYSGYVTGFWYISVPSFDSGVQVVIRTHEPMEKEKFQLHSDIGDYIDHDMLYRITDKDISGLNSVPAMKWASEKKVFALFDMERDD